MIACEYSSGLHNSKRVKQELHEPSRVRDSPNVIITPRVGGQAATRIDDLTNFFCENLRRYLAGRPLVNLVEKRLGFPLPDAS